MEFGYSPVVAAPLGLRRQLLIALVVPAIVVLGAMFYFADVAVRRGLDDAFGERLVAIARLTATTVEPRVTLVDRGDDELRIVKRTRKKLDQLIEATGVDRVLIIRLSDHAVVVDSSGALVIGDEYVRGKVDRLELDTVAGGSSVASVLFRGVEGRWYKTGYAPISEGAAVVVNAPAGFFELIDDLRNTLGAITFVGLIGLIALAVTSARRVAIPLSKLSEAAERIGAGDLSADIPTGGPKEAAVLAETMKHMAESLSARDEEMQVMLGGIAHEVRNPLGGIELFGSLLREDLDDDDPRRKHVDKILKEIKVLAGVVNDFLAFARKHPLQPRRVRLRELVGEVVSIAKSAPADKTVAVEFDVDRKLSANLDPEAMNRALLNLVRNAVQATPDGGRVDVWAGAGPSGGLRFTIDDTGPGIPEDKRDEIFTAFFTTKQKGTGLGLALVKKSVDAHGGTIVVENSETGGARFVIDLPEVPSDEPIEEPGLLG